MICCLPKALTSTHPVECSGFVPVWMRMPLRPRTPHTSGSIFLNFGDIVFFSSYVPSGMMYSLFSSVAQTTLSAPIGMVAVPRTALLSLLVLIRWMVAIFITVFVRVINSKQGSCKGCNLAKTDEQTLMDLTLWRYEDPAKQQHQPTNGHHRRRYQLYVRFHNSSFLPAPIPLRYGGAGNRLKLTDAGAPNPTPDRRCTSSTPSWSSYHADCCAEPRSPSGPAKSS